MKLTLKTVVIALGALVLFQACKSNGKQQEQQKLPTQDELIEQNKLEAQAESARIDALIKRRKWNMQETGTGLRYEFLQRGDSLTQTAQVKQEALVNTRVELLTGELIYTTEKNGPQWFKIGMSHVESGLHEGIQLMRVGDKARFIMPQHLAHGLVGDFHAIPPKSTLIYQVELLQLR